MKDKDREMAKAINAEFSDDEDEEDDNKSNWDEEEKVYLFFSRFNAQFSFCLLQLHFFYAAARS